MRLTNEKIKEFLGDSAPTTDGDKIRLVLANFVLANEQLEPLYNWRENEVIDDLIRIANELDAREVA